MKKQVKDVQSDSEVVTSALTEPMKQKFVLKNHLLILLKLSN